MSTGTRNLDSSGPLRRNRLEPPMPARCSPARRPDCERLRLVGIDDSAQPNDNVLDNEEIFARPPRRSFADYLAEQQAANPHEAEQDVEAAKSLPQREPGVDLRMLQSQGIDTAKLAAFMNAVPAVKKGERQAASEALSKAIEMPRAKTDLQHILQADKVCMVARPQGNEATPAAVIEAKVEPFPVPSAAPLSAPILKQKKPHFLDVTQEYLVENWPKLPPNVQAAILHVIDVAISPDE